MNGGCHAARLGRAARPSTAPPAWHPSIRNTQGAAPDAARNGIEELNDLTPQTRHLPAPSHDLQALVFVLGRSGDPVAFAKALVLEYGGFWLGGRRDGRLSAISLFGVLGFASGGHDALEAWMRAATAMRITRRIVGMSAVD